MKKYVLMVLFAVCVGAISNVNAQLAPITGSAFSYQGELIDNGSPANGNYNFVVKLYLSAAGGTAIIDEVYNSVPVANGLFHLEIDFGDVVYENSDQLYLEFEVTPAAGGSSVVLEPRTKLLATPYAVQAQYLAPGTASNGDVLTFDGMKWAPQAGTSSLWNASGSTLTSPGKVGVGEPTPSAQLHITNNQSQISLLKVDDVSDTRLVVQADGRTGIGVTNPSDRVHVKAEAGQNALRVQVDGGTKLRVRENGGTSLGSNFTNVPENGLYVAGDVKQNVQSNGMLKFMLRASCDSTPTIIRQYNGTNVAGDATISESGGQCTIIFPFNVTNSYISATPIQINSTNRTINCANLFSGVVCELTVASSGASIDGAFDLLIY